MDPGDILTEKNNSDQSELPSVRESLITEINALHHELRRVKDALERAGGSSHDLEKKAQQLSKNIRLSENDLRNL